MRFVIIGLVLMLGACAGSQEKKGVPVQKQKVAVQQESAPVQRESGGSIIEKSGEAPSWKSSKSHYAEGDKHYFIGHVGGANDQESAVQKASTAALSTVSKYINVQVKSDLRTYSENLGGDNGEVTLSATKESGAMINLSKYDEDVYYEKWSRNGMVQYDAYVRIGITTETMKTLELERDGLREWAVLNNTCGVDASPFIRETASRKGWKLTPAQSAIADENSVQQLFAAPKNAFFLVTKPTCTVSGANGSFSAKAFLVFDHYRLTEKSHDITFSAEGQGSGATEDEAKAAALKNAQESMIKKLFTYTGVSFTTQLPEINISSSLADVNVELLEIYEKAQNTEKMGRLFPQKAIAGWQRLVDAAEINPYRDAALKRIELWQQYENKKNILDGKIKVDKEKLKKVFGLTVVSLDEKVKYTREFLYNYVPFYGADELNELLNSVGKKDERAKLYDTLFAKEVKDEWKMACDRGDGSACYFLAISDDSKSRPNQLRRACDMQISAACHDIALSYTNSDRQKSVEFSEKACLLGRSGACFLAGITYYTGSGTVNVNMNKAVKYLDYACQKNNQGGCAYMGWIYEHGENVTKDSDQAREFYKKACTLGHIKSCQRLSE